MAKTTKKKNPKSAEVADDELDDLAALEELADLENDEDEDEDEDEVLDDEDDEEEDEDEDEDEDEAPKKKGKKKKAKKEREPRDFVGTQEIAEKAGVDSRTLRMVLRKHAIEKDPDSNQYRWDSFSDPTVKKILKLLKGGEAAKVKKEGLDRLKAQKAEKDAAKKDKKGKGKKGKKKKVVDEDDDE